MPAAELRHAYFLVAVSNKLNLDLRVRHALAGFSNSGTGVWAYVDIREGDYISFVFCCARIESLQGRQDGSHRRFPRSATLAARNFQGVGQDVLLPIQASSPGV